MDGSNGRPWSSPITSAEPLRTVATSECVVPRSMPIASRRWWGSGDSPGSEIWSSAMSAGRHCLPCAAHAGTRGATIQLIAAALPLAPARVRKLDVMLVVALASAPVDVGPGERIATLQVPTLGARTAAGHVRREDRRPQGARRRGRIGQEGDKNPKGVAARDAMQQGEIASGAVRANQGVGKRIDVERHRIEARGP